MRVLAKRFTVVLILFFIISASTTAEMESPAIQSNNLAPSLSVHSSNKMCSLYSIFFENCLPQLASVYFVFSIVYLWFLVYWTLVCFEVTAKFRRIHLLMAGLILTKALNLIYEAANVTGTYRSGLLFYISKLISVVLLSIVIQLISSGLHFMEPIMQKVDYYVLLLSIVLQVLTNVIRIVIGNVRNSINDWVILNDIVVLIDLIACGAIIIPLTSSIVSMNTGGMRDKSFQKLDVLRNFYAIVMLYFVFMTLVGPARKNGRTGLNAIDAQEYVMSYWVVEMHSLHFYMIIFNMFRKQIVVLVDHDK